MINFGAKNAIDGSLEWHKVRSFLSVTILVLVTGFLPARTVAADLYATNPNIRLDGSASVSIILFGEIEQGDSKRFEEVVNTLNAKGIVLRELYLYSPGGSLAEGLAIGRLVRSKLISTAAPSVDDKERSCISDGLFGDLSLQISASGETFTNQDNPNCICASACALAWFGGVERSGQVGFHHASIPVGIQFDSFDEFSKRLAVSRPMISNYLDEMHAPVWVHDAIFSTASNKVRFFDTMEIEDLEMDPLYREFLLAQCPRRDPISNLQCEFGASRAQQRVVQLGE